MVARFSKALASKLFSNRNNHKETKFSFCQRSPTVPVTANDRNDHDHWDRIRVYLCDHSNHEQSSAIAKVNGNHQCSNCSDCNDHNNPSNHMETIVQRLQ